MNTDNKKMRVGSRASRLAVIQADEIHSLLREKGIDAAFDRRTYATRGDRDMKTPLTENDADDFFTDTLDEALLNREIDIAVHSAKDLPRRMRDGLCLFALTAGLDETDAFVGKVRFGELKAGAKVGTSSEIRQKAVKALKPEVDVVDIRGPIEERMRLVESGVCDGIIVATAALKRLGLERHIKDIMPWEAAPLQGQLAVVGRAGDAGAQALFSSIDVRRTYGRVCLAGAGPGDPDLITMKAVKALKQADCVFYDYLAPKGLLVYAGNAEKVYVGKRKGEHTLPQEELSALLRQRAMQGKNVVRLKGGDPLIFGRGSEEIRYLRAYHIDVQVIPGVSSATGVPSSLGVPLTARGISSSVAFVSGYGRDEKGPEPRPVDIPDVGTIVVLMGLTKLDTVVASLERAGWPGKTPVLVVSRGTCADEKIVSGDLTTIVGKVREARLEHPVLIVAGRTVRFWDPHSSARGGILYTGTDPAKFNPLGRVTHLPMIQIEPAPLGPREVQALIDNLTQCHMILLTSRFAVEHFFRILEGRHYDLGRLKEKHFVVIGESTAQALRECHFEPALTARLGTSEGMLTAITERFDVKGKKILFPRSSLPNPYLKEELAKRGAQVGEVTVYRNVKPPRRDLPAEGIDRVVFTSPSTVRNFLRDYGSIPAHWKILSRGPATSRSLREAGYSKIKEIVVS